MKLTDQIIKYMGGSDKTCHCFVASTIVLAINTLFGFMLAVTIGILLGIAEYIKEDKLDSFFDMQDLKWTYYGIIFGLTISLAGLLL